MFMHRLSAFFLCLLCCLLTGCLVDGVKKQSAAQPQKPGSSDSFYVSGRFVKGVLDQASVQIFPFVDGKLSANPISGSTTDSQGRYEMQIPREYLGSPALITVSSAKRMKCDLVYGCGDHIFGAWMPLGLEDDKPVLSVAVPELVEGGIYNGTALTHLAFVLAEFELSGSANSFIKTKIWDSNTKVVSAFGLVGDLPSLKVFDITDERDYGSANSLELKYSMVNSAAVASAVQTYAESDQFVALAKLSEQFKSVGIPGVAVTRNREVTQIALLESLADTYQFIQDLTGRHYTTELSETLTLRNLFLHESAGEYSRGTASESATLASVEKAKKMLSSVRAFAFSMDLYKLAKFSNLAAFTSGEIADALKGFGVELDTSEILKGEQTDHNLDALGAVVKAVVDALMLYYENKPIPGVVQGVEMTHIGNAQHHAFQIRDTINVCESKNGAGCNVPVDLLITVNLSSFRGNRGTSVLVIDDLRLSFAGTVGDAGHKFIFPGTGSGFSADQLFLQKGIDGVQDKILFEINGWALDIPFGIASSEEESTASLSGIIDASGERFGITIDEQESVSETDTTVDTASTSLLGLYDLRGFSLNASFSVEVNSDDQFFAAFNIKQGALPFEGAAVYRSSSRKVCDKFSGECRIQDESSALEGETNENFIKLSASAAYKAKLKAISSPVLIQITGSRESPTTNNINSLKVNYPGHALALKGRFNNNGGIIALDATNLDGTRLYFDTINKKRTGAVEISSGEKAADIIDMGQWVKVRYMNGDFESF